MNGLSDVVGNDEFWVGVSFGKGDGIEEVSESGDQRRLTQCQSLTVTCWVSRGHGVSEDYIPRDRMRLPYSRSSMNPQDAGLHLLRKVAGGMIPQPAKHQGMPM